MKQLIPNWDLDNIGSFCYEHFTKKLKREFSEDTMIDILKNHSHWFDITQAIIALREIGTAECIEHLKNIASNYNGSKKMDIQAAAVLTIAKLANGTENEYLGKLLIDENFKNKWYTMAAIFHKANKNALPYVLEYGNAKIKKSKNMPKIGGLILAYLAEYASKNEQAKKIFSNINKDFEEMDNGTKEYLRKEFPDVFAQAG